MNAKDFTIKFQFDNVKKFYNSLIEFNTIKKISIMDKTIMLEEENSCGDTMISYSFVNEDFSGMIGYLDVDILEEFLHLIKCIEIARAYGIAVKDINKYILGE